MDSGSHDLTRKWKDAKDKISAENAKKRRRIEFVLAAKPAVSSSTGHLSAGTNQLSASEKKNSEPPKVTNNSAALPVKIVFNLVPG